MPIDSLLPVLSSLLEPQAGGGGSFSGGGGGGGSGGSGGGDGVGWILYVLIRLAFEYPLIGVPLLIVAVFVMFKGSKAGWFKHQERTIRRTSKQRRRRASRSSADVLRQTDPDFDERHFLSRVGVAFGKAQQSWCEQDLEPLRPFVSDGVFERFSLQIEEQREDGWRQGMEGLEVGPPTIVLVDTGRHFDSITVRIPFRADIHRLSLETGKKISGSKLPRSSFVECWTFVRRRGARSVTEGGLIEGKCPNCGAPLSMNQSARCGSCECLARSGQYDWVLTEITQESVWSPETEGEIPGFASTLERDPGMNVQLLEDRASVAFWRKCAADRADGVDPLTRVGDAEFVERYAAELAAAPKRPRTYIGDCAVGSVCTLGLLDGDERDRAVVEIVWDGRRVRVAERGKRVLDKNRVIHRTLFVLARKAGAETRLDDTFTTACCRTCGAHDTGGTDPACPYCESPRTGDKSTWLLTEILAEGSAEATKLRQELRQEVAALSRGAPLARPARPSAAGLFWWAVATAQQDGRIDPKERAALESLAARQGLDAQDLETLLRSQVSGTSAPEPRDESEARSWLRSLVQLALADGAIQSSEKRFLTHAAQRLKLSRRDLDGIVRTARSDLYRESIAAKKE